MAGKHANPGTFGTIASDYVTARARELVGQLDTFNQLPADQRAEMLVSGDFGVMAWIGQASELLRELTRDA